MNLEKYRREIKNRVSVYQALIAVALVFVIIGNVLLKDRGQTVETVRGFATGLFIGIELVCVFQLGKLWKMLKDEEVLKEVYIREHDEREALIQMKSGLHVIPVLSFIILICAILVGFFNDTIFYTLVVVGIGQILIALALKIYWKMHL
ncbi:hypothetical protein [Facklamia hominis]|uniref:hypothetical protein n=1 Tax=Facklamia hominis TaxID=178214 RepID=UPI0003528AE7|nr:hypothetical protein [Facklamia hominis]EPH10896.1 hypothetical protein HMPREF9260_01098 [Facklamia hominis ACS-120-V-Sch10]